MTKLLQTINKVQRKINSNLTIAGVAITLADMKTNLAKSTIETIRDSFGRNIRVFDSVIPVATKAGEVSISGKTSIPIIMNIFKKEIYNPLINLDNLQEMKL